MWRVQRPHHLYLVEEGQSVRLVVGVDRVLLRERLHREVPLVSQALHLVDCRKAALAQFLDWLVQPVEAQLVQAPREQPHPNLCHAFTEDEDLKGLASRALQLKTDHPRVNGPVRGRLGELELVEGLELEVVVKRRVEHVLRRRCGGVSENNVGVCEEDTGLSAGVSVEPTGTLEAALVGLDCLHDLGGDLPEERLERCLHQ